MYPVGVETFYLSLDCSGLGQLNPYNILPAEKYKVSNKQTHGHSKQLGRSLLYLRMKSMGMRLKQPSPMSLNFLSKKVPCKQRKILQEYLIAGNSTACI